MISFYPIVDPERPGDFNQAVMDLGTSLMSTKTETLSDSPFARFNLSYQEGVELTFPIKSKKSSKSRSFMRRLSLKMMAAWLIPNALKQAYLPIFDLSFARI